MQPGYPGPGEDPYGQQQPPYSDPYAQPQYPPPQYGDPYAQPQPQYDPYAQPQQTSGSPYPTPGYPLQPGYPGAPQYPVAGYGGVVGPPTQQQSTVVGLLAMIFGIVGAVLSPCCGYFGFPFDVTAIVLGIVGLRKAANGQAPNRGQALAGLICGCAGVVLGIVSVIVISKINFNQSG